jgi:hypothetical protein
MQYTLITQTGRVMQFFILATAETFQLAYGGVIVTNKVLETEVDNCKMEKMYD